MKVIEDIYYTKEKHEMKMLDIYLPEAKAFPVFVYFHGGGIRSGSRKDYVFFSQLAEKGIAVVSAEYRLYPEASYPEFLKDAAAAVAWVHNNMSEYGEVKGIFVGGSSAGGYLTQMLCFDKKYLGIYEIDADSIDGYIMDAGQPTVHFNILEERGIDSRRVIIDEAAPIFHINGERNYPKMLIIVADNDMENRYEQNLLMASTLKHFGFEEKVNFKLMENHGHCEYIKELNDKGESVFAGMVYEFISKVTEEK